MGEQSETMSKTPGSASRRARTPLPALKSRTVPRYEDKRDMDVNNYTLEMRLKFCKDLRILAEQIEITKQRILDKVEIGVNERTALTQAENNDLDDKIEGVDSEKNRIQDVVADLKERLRQLKAEAKDVAARRPKAEAERTETVEKRRRVKEEEEDLREALAAAIKQGDDLRREIASLEAGVDELRRKGELKAEECENMTAQLPELVTKIETETAHYQEDQAYYDKWMREHGLDPTANWNIAGADQIRQLRAVLRKEYEEALTLKELEIDESNKEEWTNKSDRLADLIEAGQAERDAELAVRDQLTEVTTERDDLDAEIKALRMVIAMLIESNQPDGDDADKRARVAELTAMLNDLQRELEPLRVRELDLIVEHEQLRAGISNSKLLLEGYLADISSLKAKRIKAEKEVTKGLALVAAASTRYRVNEDGYLVEIVSKDDKVITLQKNVEELQREKLNADYISLQEEITEYKVILTGWCGPQ